MDRQSSYTAASSVPYKLFRNRPLMRAFSLGHVPLTHLQFAPTNRCNLKCSFCSCDNRTRDLEMPIEESVELAERVAELGCQSVTITGGGEPLLHPRINDIILAFANNDMDVGLVTNGELILRLCEAELLTWCRVSASDERAIPSDLSAFVSAYPQVDWAFSYVLSSNPDIDNLKAHIEFAEEHDFMHVRVVSDILDPDDTAMHYARSLVDSPLAIWQTRSFHEEGAKVCHVSQLKPQVGPDGMVYPCCGVQYAQESPSLDFSMAMGHWRDLPFDSFDGSQCVRCYYGDYNRAVGAMVGEVAHGTFV